MTEAETQPRPGELWLHTKTQTQYKVIGVVCNAVAGQPFVVYEGPQTLSGKKQFTRQLRGNDTAWFSLNEDGDPRFVPVKEKGTFSYAAFVDPDTGALRIRRWQNNEDARAAWLHVNKNSLVLDVKEGARLFLAQCKEDLITWLAKGERFWCAVVFDAPSKGWCLVDLTEFGGDRLPLNAAVATVLGCELVGYCDIVWRCTDSRPEKALLLALVKALEPKSIVTATLTPYHTTFRNTQGNVLSIWSGDRLVYAVKGDQQNG